MQRVIRVNHNGPATKVRAIMSAPAITVDCTDTIAFAEELMNVERIRHLPVVDGDVLLGIVSHRDILAASMSTLTDPDEEEDLEHKRKFDVTRVMHGSVETVTPDTPAAQAANTLLAQKLGCVLVVDERHRLVGIVTSSDFVRLARDLLLEGLDGGLSQAPRRVSSARR